MTQILDPEVAYDLQRFTDEAIVKGPQLLSPMKGDAFLRILEAVKSPASPAVAATAAADSAAADTIAKLQEQLLVGQAAGESAQKEWAAKLAPLEAELAAAVKRGAEVAQSLAAREEETTAQGNTIRELEEKLAAADAAAKAAIEEAAAKITALEAKVKALAAV